MFRELFDVAPDAMIVVDTSGRIVRANPQAEALFGFDASAMTGRPIEMLIPESARHSHASHRAGYVANPRVRLMGTGQELIGLKRSGETFPVEIALSPLNSPLGQFFLAAVRDVSETQLARKALVRSRFDAVLARVGQLALSEASPDAAMQKALEPVVAVLGVQAVAIVFRHARLRQMQVRVALGINPERINGLSWSLISDKAAEHGAQATDPLLVEGFDSTAVFPLFDTNEPMGALLVLSREFRNYDHDAAHFLQSVANILATAVQRSRIEEQLSHGQRLEAIGQLTGGVAHDFNNLLTVISGNLQILEDELSDRPGAREVLGSALRAVDRGAELTRNLLVFARRQRLSPRASDPTKLIGDLGVMLQRTLGEAINVEIACAGDVARVFADPSQLDSALVNLALNSRDAMPRGGELSIRVFNEHVGEPDKVDGLKSGGYVVFEVRDTGSGMTPEVSDRVFEPFFTTKESGKGSGLGLSMVYGFVKQSGGQLTLKSQLGYGTTIRLYLPAVDASTEAAGDISPMLAAGGNETVLVVEDEAEVRDIACAFLRSFGYTVIAAANAEAAISLLASDGRIALVFSDVVLGTGMTGVELAEHVWQSRPGVAVLLTSGYEHAALQIADSAEERFEVLRKPYRRQDLGVAVRRSLAQR
ncbi:MAG: ATP-binding protein [Rudaea sp.]